jgi:hypothetical protein
MGTYNTDETFEQAEDEPAQALKKQRSSKKSKT